MPVIVTTPYFVPNNLTQIFDSGIRFQGNDTVNGDYFGFSVDTNTTGSTAIIGARNENENGTEAGAAYVFIKSGGSPEWVQAQKLIGSDTNDNDNFGYSVAMSADGNTLIVGAVNQDTPGTNNGAVYVFKKTGGSPEWVEEAILKPSDHYTNHGFGVSCSLTSDGTVALVGASGDDVGGNGAGAAYIFTRTGGSPLWEQTQKLKANDPAELTNVGREVSISGDGTYLILGAPNADIPPGNNNEGAAYVFAKSGSPSTWTQQAKLTASDIGSTDEFGDSVTINDDGSVIAVGARFVDVGSPLPFTPGVGAVYVFKRGTGSPLWTEQQKIRRIDSSNFGSYVSLSSTGDKLLIGAPSEVVGVDAEGAAHIYIEQAGTWNHHQKLVSFDGTASDRYGEQLVLSKDGSTSIITAYGFVGLANAGACYVHTI